MESKVACFTGHRPNKLKGYNPEDNKELLWRIHKEVVNLIENRGVITFINGLALGIDMWSAKIVIKLKEKCPQIKLISAVPCRNHPCKWQKQDKDMWQEVCDKSDEVVLVTDEDYKPYLMQIRNEWMCNKSDYIIAVWNGSKAGTGNCVNFAEKQNKEIIRIIP
jgi:uncharacterized phage-like protein YoqJ